MFKIKLNKLKEIYNPTENEAGNYPKINFNLIKNYIDNPSEYKILEHLNDNISNLHKDIALYIINSYNEKDRLISVDLNNSNIITNGFNEYVKSIYNQQKEIYIDIPNSDNPLDNNNIFILDKKNVVSVKDTETNIANYSENQIFFFDNKEKINNIWETKDLYSNFTFAINSLFETYKNTQKDRTLNTKNEINKQLSKISVDTLNNIDFQIEFINLEHSHDSFKEYMLGNDLIKINLENDNVKKCIEGLEDKKLIHMLAYVCHKEKVDDFYINLINKKSIIDYVFNKTYYSSIRNTYIEKFTPVLIYNLLNEENKKDDQIIEKYLEKNITTTMHNSKYISSFILEPIPYKHISDKNLNIIINNASAYDIKSINNKDLLDKININYIKENFNLLNKHKVGALINIIFRNKEDFTKENIIFLLKNGVNYEDIMKSSTSKKYDTDIDILKVAVHNNCISFNNIDIHNYIDALIKTHTPELEDFKIELIVNKQTSIDIHKYSNDAEKIDILKNKFQKIEYMYLKSEDDRDYFMKQPKKINKIKDENKILDLIDKINNLNIPNQYINTNNLYKDLHPDLKTNINIIKALNYEVNTQHLHKSLLYNKTIILEYLKRNSVFKDEHLKPFFNDKEFTIEYLKMLDQGVISISKSPVYIQKFFENNEVDKDYATFFKSYSQYIQLKQNTNTNNIEKKQSNKI